MDAVIALIILGVIMYTFFPTFTVLVIIFAMVVLVIIGLFQMLGSVISAVADAVRFVTDLVRERRIRKQG